MLKKQLKNILMWVVTLAIFGYLFHENPPAQLWATLKYVKKIPFFSLALLYFLIIYFWDAWVIKKVVSRFSHEVSFKDMVVARGVTYLIMVLNYTAAQASYAFFLKKRYQIPLARAFSIFTFILAVDFFWVITLAFIGSSFGYSSIGKYNLSPYIQKVALLTYFGLFVWLLFWKQQPRWLFAKLNHFDLVQKWRNHELCTVFKNATLVDYAKTFLMRTPIHTTIIFSFYILAQTSGAFIPFSKILGNIPIVFFIGTIPLTPGGVGTTPLAMVELLAPHLQSPIFATGEITAKELMLALTLLWMFTNYLLKFLTGTFLLRRVSKNLFSE